MKKAEIRLELVKLTYTHGRDAVEAVARALALESYVTEGMDLENVDNAPPSRVPTGSLEVKTPPAQGMSKKRS